MEQFQHVQKTVIFLFALYDSSVCDFFFCDNIHIVKTTIKAWCELSIRNKYQKQRTYVSQENGFLSKFFKQEEVRLL